MPTAAARIPPRLLEAILRLDDPKLPIAEVARRVGAEADRLGVTRPSYERIRLLVHEARRVRKRGPSTAEVLFDVWMRTRPPDALLDHISGVGLGPYDEAEGVK
jgi:hypothetical protein